MELKNRNGLLDRKFRGSMAVAAGILILSVPFPSAAETGAAAQSSETRTSTSSATHIAKPKVIIAKFHADWCGSCKAMGPVMEDLQNKFDGEQTLFVTFDLTNRTTKHQSELLSTALGLEKLWAENNGATGVIKIVDAQSKEVVASLNKDKTLKDMTAAISSAIK